MVRSCHAILLEVKFLLQFFFIILPNIIYFLVIPPMYVIWHFHPVYEFPTSKYMNVDYDSSEIYLKVYCSIDR